ncbi:ATP-binding cassette subfamily B protein [Nonomuraea polychroma]|uniref:ATP-binding cassette subfamily B protein n=1 Tax=Nonomuraea polychroma TaxID=46176 RepID=A0A438M8J3_9ACTN|nr:ABC transporter ATP-binding protein [Nonomuraea polychroma]RVX42043.1 ATP-binding cassette subfamily B protein [Nonomuraea polychroma]
MVNTPREGRRLSRRLSFVASGRELAPAITLRRTFREFWPDTRGLRRLFAAGVVLAIVAALCEVAAIRLFGHITDEVLATRELGAFWVPAVSWLGLAAVAGVASFAGSYVTALGAERFLLGLRDRVFAHIQKLAPDFSEKRRLGDLMARLTDDVEAIEELVGSGLVKALTAAAGAVFFAGAAFLIRWDLALVTFALIPAFLLVSRAFAARFRTAAARERYSNGAMNSVLEEGLANQPLVQAYNRQPAEARRLHTEGRTWLRANMAQAWLSGLYGPAVQVIETVCLIVILGVGAWEIAAGRLTIGGLLAFAAYLALLYPAVQSLGELALTVSEAAAGSDRIIEILRTKPAVTDAPGAVAAGTRGRCRGRVDFERVGFTYPGRGRPVLREVSFAAEPGELLVLTGPSGAGKSTLAKLLLRFYDPDAGRILLDGADIRGLTRESLRANVTVLHQETLLFSGSVRDNIAYGRPDASHDEVIKAAEAAGVHDFVKLLPQGYDTPVGQRGRLLSGGQRQRIAIARAILRDAPVLVLDEPMSGLDETMATQVMQPLRRLMAGRTTILITHDLRHAPEGARIVELEPVPRESRLRLKRIGTPARRPAPSRDAHHETASGAARQPASPGMARQVVSSVSPSDRMCGAQQGTLSDPGRHAAGAPDALHGVRQGTAPGPRDDSPES